ncbi:hypothetical protein AOLI_G00013030 [Acnodon oligacanthus]
MPVKAEFLKAPTMRSKEVLPSRIGYSFGIHFTHAPVMHQPRMFHTDINQISAYRLVLPDLIETHSGQWPELPKADFDARTPAERLSFRHLDGNKAEIVTLEDEDVVAMGTLNPTVTQVLPGRYAIP